MHLGILWIDRPKLTVSFLDLQMAPKKRPGERWFMFAPDELWQEYETLRDDLYVPKDGIVLAWPFKL